MPDDNKTCPNCGYCPTCGRSAPPEQPVPVPVPVPVPYYPSSWPYAPWFQPVGPSWLYVPSTFTVTSATGPTGVTTEWSGPLTD